jgi:hypothetical protein
MRYKGTRAYKGFKLQGAAPVACWLHHLDAYCTLLFTQPLCALRLCASAPLLTPCPLSSPTLAHFILLLPGTRHCASSLHVSVTSRLSPKDGGVRRQYPAWLLGEKHVLYVLYCIMDYQLPGVVFALQRFYHSCCEAPVLTTFTTTTTALHYCSPLLSTALLVTLLQYSLKTTSVSYPQRRYSPPLFLYFFVYSSSLLFSSLLLTSSTTVVVVSH